MRTYFEISISAIRNIPSCSFIHPKICKFISKVKKTVLRTYKIYWSDCTFEGFSQKSNHIVLKGLYTKVDHLVSVKEILRGQNLYLSIISPVVYRIESSEMSRQNRYKQSKFWNFKTFGCYCDIRFSIEKIRLKFILNFPRIFVKWQLTSYKSDSVRKGDFLIFSNIT